MHVNHRLPPPSKTSRGLLQTSVAAELKDNWVPASLEKVCDAG